MGDEQRSAERGSTQSGTGAAQTDIATRFLAHLEYATKAVQNLPAYKQRALGGAPIEPLMARHESKPAQSCGDAQ
jgi:hypothetical protein